MSGIEINDKWIKINFKVDIKSREKGEIIGVDQGINKIVVMSDGQKTPAKCIHGHTLKTILNKLSQRRQGSKGFKKAQDHRKNFINWSINQLNFNEIKEIRLEKLKDFFYKQHKGKLMSHWTYSLIRYKIMNKAQEHGVHVIEQPSHYRSQRCSSCGLVMKSNRKKEIYHCSSCGIIIDSDLNAAKNHAQDLSPIRFQSGLNKTGFYWLQSSLFNLDGRSLQSLPCQK